MNNIKLRIQEILVFAALIGFLYLSFTIKEKKIEEYKGPEQIENINEG